MAFNSKKHQGHHLMADINVTPMVDVMLVLLVIFIMAAPLLTHSIKINLPNEKAQHATSDTLPVVLSIDAKGQYFIDNIAVKDNDLLVSLSTLFAKNAQTPIHIRADKAVPYEKVAHLLATAQTVGLTKISFLTQSVGSTSK